MKILQTQKHSLYIFYKTFCGLELKRLEAVMNRKYIDILHKIVS